MIEIGPHLLGRVPSPPDERDWALGDFLASDAQLRDEAVVLLKRTVRGYHDRRYPNPPTKGSDWGKALALLAQIGGSAPSPTPPPQPSGNVWTDSEAVLDQGNTGTCVGNGWAQWGNTLPVDDRFNEAAAQAIYLEATRIDYGTPDTSLQKGSTVRSGAKAMQGRSRLSSYAFAASLADVIAWLKGKGPVVFGTDWTDDMFNPDANGYIAPTGAVAGGHCYLAIGYLPDEDAIEFLNSWSDTWGLKGRFKMKTADVQTLLGQGGEACAAVELAA